MKRRVPVVSESAQTIATNARRRRQAGRSVVQVQRLLLATQPLTGFGGALERLDLRQPRSPGHLPREPDLDRERKKAWALVHGVLDALWDFAEGKTFEAALARAEITREFDTDATPA